MSTRQETPDADVPHVGRWGRWEERFESRAEFSAPLQDVEVFVELMAPSGKRRWVRAFWDGQQTWRVRFSPDEVGDWIYRSSSNPTDAGLHDQTGSFSCISHKSDNPLYAHGAIVVAPSGHYLQHADGKPFFYLADTCWNGPLLADSDEWAFYLADRVAKRFTAVQFILTPFRGIPADAKGRVAYTGTERISINPAFYQDLDWHVDRINAAGVLAVPIILHAGRDTVRNPGHGLPKDQATLLARYVVARYGGHHVLWDFVAEGKFHGEGAAYWRSVGRDVFDTEPHAPVTLHPYPMDWALEEFAGERWMDVLGYQSAHGDNEAYLRWIPQGPPSADWMHEPPRPLINLEPPYEGHVAAHSRQPFDAATVRRHTYWSLLVSPTAGVAYGGQGVWGWDDGTGVPYAHEHTGTAPHWRDALDHPGATSMCHLAELMDTLPWWRLRPAPDLLAEQPGEADPRLATVAAQTDDRRYTVAYVPRDSRLRLRLGDQPHDLRATWFSPATGTRHAVDIPTGGATEWHANTPDAEDWVLLLEGKGA